MKKRLYRIFCGVLTLLLLASLLPSAVFAAPNKTEAYAALYEYMLEEVAGLGGAVRDEGYYKMFTDKIHRPAITEKILAARLLDVTGDGVEELILKRYVTHSSDAMLDLSDHEWVCIYSYVNGSIKRIGQNSMWIRKVDGGWSYYEPTGYIGSILSSHEFPYISDNCVYYCKGKDGKIYLADGIPDSAYTEGTYSFYTYNGSVMAKTCTLEIMFLPDWRVGSITSSYGTYAYYINGQRVSYDQYSAKLKSYTGGGTIRLANNDYNLVLNRLASEVTGFYTPSSWAVSEVNQAVELGYVPESLQKNYTKPITRGEFCALATNLYESYTGEEIVERTEFADTTDENVLKMGALGVVNGVGDDKFAPDNLLTRQQAATILARLAGVMGTELPEGPVEYADNDLIAGWAKTQVGQVAAAGVMNGVGGNKFDPLSSYTREQAILTILRLSNALD